MINLVKELRTLLAEKHLSPEKASHFIGCSTNSVIRWLRNENPPSQVYRRMIQEGIAKIKEAYPEIKKQRLYLGFVSSYCPGLKLSEKQKDFYEDVLTQMAFSEVCKKFFKKGIAPETVDKGILEAAKRLGIPWPK